MKGQCSDKKRRMHRLRKSRGISLPQAPVKPARNGKTQLRRKPDVWLVCSELIHDALCIITVHEPDDVLHAIQQQHGLDQSLYDRPCQRQHGKPKAWEKHMAAGQQVNAAAHDATVLHRCHGPWPKKRDCATFESSGKHSWTEAARELVMSQSMTSSAPL